MPNLSALRHGKPAMSEQVLVETLGRSPPVVRRNALAINPSQALTQSPFTAARHDSKGTTIAQRNGSLVLVDGRRAGR
jgi:hypothetical protein